MSKVILSVLCMFRVQKLSLFLQHVHCESKSFFLQASAAKQQRNTNLSRAYVDMLDHI